MLLAEWTAGEAIYDPSCCPPRPTSSAPRQQRVGGRSAGSGGAACGRARARLGRLTAARPACGPSPRPGGRKAGWLRPSRLVVRSGPSSRSSATRSATVLRVMPVQSLMARTDSPWARSSAMPVALSFLTNGSLVSSSAADRRASAHPNETCGPAMAANARITVSGPFSGRSRRPCLVSRQRCQRNGTTTPPRRARVRAPRSRRLTGPGNSTEFP